MPPQPFIMRIAVMRITPIESRRENRGFLIGDGQDATLFQSDWPRGAPKMLSGEFLLQHANADKHLVQNEVHLAMSQLALFLCLFGLNR
jgi:hypothetical protein